MKILKLNDSVHSELKNYLTGDDKYKKIGMQEYVEHLVIDSIKKNHLKNMNANTRNYDELKNLVHIKNTTTIPNKLHFIEFTKENITTTVVNSVEFKFTKADIVKNDFDFILNLLNKIDEIGVVSHKKLLIDTNNHNSFRNIITIILNELNNIDPDHNAYINELIIIMPNDLKVFINDLVLPYKIIYMDNINKIYLLQKKIAEDSTGLVYIFNDGFESLTETQFKLVEKGNCSKMFGIINYDIINSKIQLDLNDLVRVDSEASSYLNYTNEKVSIECDVNKSFNSGLVYSEIHRVVYKKLANITPVFESDINLDMYASVFLTENGTSAKFVEFATYVKKSLLSILKDEKTSKPINVVTNPLVANVLLDISTYSENCISPISANLPYKIISFKSENGTIVNIYCDPYIKYNDKYMYVLLDAEVKYNDNIVREITDNSGICTAELAFKCSANILKINIIDNNDYLL